MKSGRSRLRRDKKLKIVQSEKVAQRERGGGWTAATAALKIGGQLGSDIFI